MTEISVPMESVFSKYAELILKDVLAADKEKSNVTSIALLELKSVDKICDIPCDAQMEIEFLKKGAYNNNADRVRLRFIAEARHVLIHDYSMQFRYLSHIQTCSVNLDEITTMVEELFVNILPNLVFNYMTSEMEVGVNSLSQITASILADIKTVTMCDKCSVCLVPTKRKTTCNHSLCVPCADKLLNNAEIEEEECAPCPICRQGHVNRTI